MSLTSSEKKPLRRIAHHLSPIVQIGEQGISSGVVEETQRALLDHELIKIKFNSQDRQQRDRQLQELIAACDAQLIQSIGKTVVLFRPNLRADRRLSNLHRYAGGA